LIGLKQQRLKLFKLPFLYGGCPQADTQHRG